MAVLTSAGVARGKSEWFSLEIDLPNANEIVHTVRRRYAAARYARHTTRALVIRGAVQVAQPGVPRTLHAG